MRAGSAVRTTAAAVAAARAFDDSIMVFAKVYIERPGQKIEDKMR